MKQRKELENIISDSLIIESTLVHQKHGNGDHEHPPHGTTPGSVDLQEPFPLGCEPPLRIPVDR